MEAYNQRYGNKGLSLFYLAGLFILLFILSFFSVNNVYGFDSGIITSNDVNNSNINDNNSNNYNLVFEDDSDYQNRSVQNADSNGTGNFESNGTIIINKGSTNVYTSIKSSTSSDGCLVTSLCSVDNNYISKAISNPSSTNSSIFSHSSHSHYYSNYSQYSHYTDNFFNHDYGDSYAFNTLDQDDGLEKIGENSIKVDNIDFNSLFSIFQNIDKYNKYDHDNVDANDYLINPPVVILISDSDFKGTDLEKYNNFVNEVSTLNFNKIGTNEHTSVILPFESCPRPILTVLFFITIFMEHHDNGKEPSNSF